MNSEQTKSVIGIAAGLAFVVGFGIGVALYAETSGTSSKESDFSSQVTFFEFSHSRTQN